MTTEQAIAKLEKLSKLTSSAEPCRMAIAALRREQRVRRVFGLALVVVLSIYSLGHGV